MCPNYLWMAVPVAIHLPNLGLLTKTPPFLGTG